MSTIGEGRDARIIFVFIDNNTFISHEPAQVNLLKPDILNASSLSEEL